MEKKLNRNMQDKMIGGVARGLADYLDIDVTIVRVLLVLAVVFHGAGLLIYVVLWVAMPAGPQPNGEGAMPPPPGQSPFQSAPQTPTYQSTSQTPPFQGASQAPPFQGAAEQMPPGKSSSGRSGPLIGWILVGLGVFFLADDILPNWFEEFYYWFNFRRIWPLIFIIIGALIIASASKKSPGNQPSENQPPENQPSGNQPSGSQPPENQPSGNQSHPDGNQSLPEESQAPEDDNSDLNTKP